MADLIQNALAKTKNEVNSKVSVATATVTNKVSAANANIDNINKKLEQLPSLDELDIRLRQKEKEFWDKKKEVDEFLLLSPEEKLEKAKQILNRFSIPPNPFPIQIPVFDRKILQAFSMSRILKQLRTLRKKITELGQRRSAKLHKYPLKPSSLRLPTLPTVPTALPTIAQIPKIPSLPVDVGSKLRQLPQIPSAPTIPRIPRILT